MFLHEVGRQSLESSWCSVDMLLSVCRCSTRPYHMILPALGTVLCCQRDRRYEEVGVSEEAAQVSSAELLMLVDWDWA